MLSGMPPFWGRTDGEIFDRILNEPLDLKIEPWPEISAPAQDLVAGCALDPIPVLNVTGSQGLVHRLPVTADIEWYPCLNYRIAARNTSLVCCFPLTPNL